MNPTSCLFRSRFASNPVHLLAGTRLFDEKICQSAALFWFGIQDVWILYSQAIIQRTIEAFLEHGSTEKIAIWAHANRDPKQAGGWFHFYMKRLRNKNSSKIFKIKNKNSINYSSWCSYQGPKIFRIKVWCNMLQCLWISFILFLHIHRFIQHFLERLETKVISILNCRTRDFRPGIESGPPRWEMSMLFEQRIISYSEHL